MLLTTVVIFLKLIFIDRNPYIRYFKAIDLFV